MHSIVKYFSILLTTLILINCGDESKLSNPPKEEPREEQIGYIDHPVMDKIRQLINDSLSGKINDVTFLTAGDSKRDGPRAEDVINYTRAFEKFKITYKHNASSAITTKEWVDNEYKKANLHFHSGLETLIADATGEEGAHSIVEFSLGTNDLARYGEKYYRDTHTLPSGAEQVNHLKKELIYGINAIQKARPKALIFMAEATGIEEPALKKALLEVSKEKDLPLIKGLLDYKNKQELQSKFFVDAHHPSVFGSKKIIQNTLRHITEGKARERVKYDTPLYATPPAIGVNLAQGATIVNQFRRTEDDYIRGAEFRSITIKVKEGTVIKSKQKGYNGLVYFLAEDGKGILKGAPKSQGAPKNHDSEGILSPLRNLPDGNKTGEFYIHVPKNTKKIVFNLSYDSNKQHTNFDSSTVDIRYMTQEEISTYLPTQEEMDEGLLQ